LWAPLTIGPATTSSFGSRPLCKVEVLARERAEICVLQCERVGARRNNDVLADLRGVGENACKACKLARAELNNIVTGSARNEILDNIVAEICGKSERVRIAMAGEKVVARGAGQRVLPC